MTYIIETRCSKFLSSRKMLSQMTSTGWDQACMLQIFVSLKNHLQSSFYHMLQKLIMLLAAFSNKYLNFVTMTNSIAISW